MLSPNKMLSEMSKIVLLEPNEAVLAGRRHWRYTGSARPPFADTPGPGQESVWDFPRPPRLETMDALVEVFLAEDCIASSRRAVRCCETAGAPTWYLPPDDVEGNLLNAAGGQSVCEWKGVAESFAVGTVADAGWRYVQMFEEFSSLYLWCAFYPGKLRCFVDGERVTPQPGGYYGGWVTRNLTGPIKGEPGSSAW